MIKDKADRSDASRPLVKISMVTLIGVAFAVISSVVGTPDARGEDEPHHFIFKRKDSGRTINKGSVEVSFTRFESEDGELVERLVENYASDQEANAELESMATHAFKVIERNSKKSWDGRRVGSRILILSKLGQQLVNVIAWNDGRRVVLLRSRSLPHVLDFEQQDYPASPPGRAAFSAKPPTPLPLK